METLFYKLHGLGYMCECGITHPTIYVDEEHITDWQTLRGLVPNEKRMDYSILYNECPNFKGKIIERGKFYILVEDEE